MTNCLLDVGRRLTPTSCTYESDTEHTVCCLYRCVYGPNVLQQVKCRPNAWTVFINKQVTNAHLEQYMYRVNIDHKKNKTDIGDKTAFT